MKRRFPSGFPSRATRSRRIPDPAADSPGRTSFSFLPSRLDPQSFPSGIFAVAESYPDLKASANFSQLQEELTNTENKIAYSRQLYNSVTSNYNVKLETFPSNVIAKMFSFKAAEFLETPEEEKAVPKVDFSGLGN